MKKYEFTGETKKMCGDIVLHRIRAVRDFGHVYAGDVGGWIEREGNLSHDGRAWVSDNARVYENARVLDGAQVDGDAQVFGNARIYEGACVYDNALVCDDAFVFGNARVSGYAAVYENAQVFGKVDIRGAAHICDCAWVRQNKHYLVIGPIGSRGDFTTFYCDTNDGIRVRCGCFAGTLDEFLQKVSETHGRNQHGKAYRAAAKLAKTILRA